MVNLGLVVGRGSKLYVENTLFDAINTQAARVFMEAYLEMRQSTIVNGLGYIGGNEWYYEGAAIYVSSRGRINLQNNIISHNKNGLYLKENWSSDDVFAVNDVWNQNKNYVLIDDKTSQDGNISQDPLFGNNYCLQAGSPAVLSDGAYMGAFAECGKSRVLYPVSENKMKAKNVTYEYQSEEFDTNDVGQFVERFDAPKMTNNGWSNESYGDDSPSENKIIRDTADQQTASFYSEQLKENAFEEKESQQLELQGSDEDHFVVDDSLTLSTDSENFWSTFFSSITNSFSKLLAVVLN